MEIQENFVFLKTFIFQNLYSVKINANRIKIGYFQAP